MRKIVLVLAAFMLAAPVMAQPVTISCVQDGTDANYVIVKFNNPGAEKVRAFALDITVDNAAHDANIVAMDSFHLEYYIYPGSIDVNDDTGDVDKWGSPDCNVNDYPGVTEPGIGSEGVSIEMGSLYDVNDNDHNQPPLQSNQTICRFKVNKMCWVSIAENTARGGVVMEDPEVDPNANLPCSPCCLALGCLVPDVDNDPNLTAQAAITAASLVPNIAIVQFDAVIPTDHVISQDPAGGTPVDCGSTVDLTICLACIVPDVETTHDHNDVAHAAIIAAGLVPNNAYEHHDTVAVDCVISQDPAGLTQVECGSTVDLIISLGPCVVPGVVGGTHAQAITDITGNGFDCNSVYTFSFSVPEFEVMSQAPAQGGTPGCGTTVNIEVSKGEPCVDPNAAFYTAWVNWGEPNCWCCHRNCRGDSDCILSGPYPVGIPDLNLFKKSYMKGAVILSTVVSDIDPRVRGICCDFDHIQAGPYRVAIADLNNFKVYYLKHATGFPVPLCPMDWDGIPPNDYRFWKTDAY